MDIFGGTSSTHFILHTICCTLQTTYITHYTENDIYNIQYALNTQTTHYKLCKHILTCLVFEHLPLILFSLKCNSLMHCTAVRAKASQHCTALPYLNTLQLVLAIPLKTLSAPSSSATLQCFPFQSVLFLCVNCLVYTAALPGQCSTIPLKYCTVT